MNVDATIATLLEVVDRWPDLEESRLKGTPRPPAPGATLTEGKRQRQNQQRREDVVLADDRAPGASVAPLHLDVLDTMANLLMAADLLHEHVAQTIGHPTLDHPASAYSDPRPYLRYVVELLPEACEDDPDMLEAAWEKADGMRSDILMALGEVFDGQRLSAVCPFCVGQTSKRLAGELTMRVRIRDIPTEENPNLAEFLVVCENPDGMCQPFAKEVDTKYGEHPAWRFSRWGWLAKQLHPIKAAS